MALAIGSQTIPFWLMREFVALSCGFLPPPTTP